MPNCFNSFICSCCWIIEQIVLTSAGLQMLTSEVSSSILFQKKLKNFCGCSSVLIYSDDKNTLSLKHSLLFSYKYTWATWNLEDMRKKSSLPPWWLAPINGVLDTSPGTEGPREGQTSGQMAFRALVMAGEIYTGRWDLLVDTKGMKYKMGNKLNWVWSKIMK